MAAGLHHLHRLHDVDAFFRVELDGTIASSAWRRRASPTRWSARTTRRCTSDGGETVQQVASASASRRRTSSSGTRSFPHDLGELARAATGRSSSSRIRRGRHGTVEKVGETPKARRTGWASRPTTCSSSTRGHPICTRRPSSRWASPSSTRDRSSEPDVFLPTQKWERALDDDGSIAGELQEQERWGDPTTTGVVWPKVAEIGLVAGLGAGKMLVRLALEELRASGTFDFVVLQATMASVSFYEELGFVRVGAVAKYHPEGTDISQNPVQGYRHWACADESQPEQFGDTSYMMAVKLRTASGQGAAKSSSASWSGRLADDLRRTAPPRAPAGATTGKRKAPAAPNRTTTASSRRRARSCRWATCRSTLTTATTRAAAALRGREDPRLARARPVPRQVEAFGGGGGDLGEDDVGALEHGRGEGGDCAV